MILTRHLDIAISDHFTKYKFIPILLGARQVGKTTILKKLFPEAKYLSVDLESVYSALEKYDIVAYEDAIGKENNIVVIDEIHKLKDPGRAAKIIYDEMSQYKLIITGSSSFRIKNKTSESLAGRKIDYKIYPLTLSEILVQRGIEKNLSFGFLDKLVSGQKLNTVYKSYDSNALLDNLMRYGTYPATLNSLENDQYLINLVDSVIFKDLMDMSVLENKTSALALLKLLSYQIGSLVNYAELASKLSIKAETVKRYIELFEQSFIVFTLKPFSQRKRDEITKMPKVYFYDLGLRNAIINNFTPIKGRGDAGAMFENFVISEILKENYYGKFGYELNYWRTKFGSEVDLVMSRNGKENIAVEIKTVAKRVNKSFMVRYPNSRLAVVTRDNFWI